MLYLANFLCVLGASSALGAIVAAPAGGLYSALSTNGGRFTGLKVQDRISPRMVFCQCSVNSSE